MLTALAYVWVYAVLAGGAFFCLWWTINHLPDFVGWCTDHPRVFWVVIVLVTTLAVLRVQTDHLWRAPH